MNTSGSDNDPPAPGDNSTGANAAALDPNDPADRAEILNTHPVRTRVFFIPTPETERVCQTIIDTIYRCASCCGFFAYSRYGKSAMARYAESTVREVLPDVPILRWIAQKTDGWDESTFYKHLLKTTMKHEAQPREPYKQLLRNGWLGAAREAESTQLVIMCDEVQRVDEAAFDLLLDMTNALEDRRVKTTFIYFAGPNIEKTRSELQGNRRADILQRFLSRCSRFEGISSKEVLETIMRTYDVLQYPPDSGWTFTRFFLPLAFAAGFRLSSCAGQCWDAFVAAARKLPRTSDTQPFEIGMEQVCDAIQIVLLHSKDSNDFEMDRRIWISAVNQSTYADSLT